ncbi:hypothetical protein [Burkholderia ubonensis]|uniref:hypothetical protein n=1 Tax=Burkholderia ubonensis TaxID=101571 RepID=UPI000ACAA721|nr:hypothetical protein [Burkholderia ubonensis]
MESLDHILANLAIGSERFLDAAALGMEPESFHVLAIKLQDGADRRLHVTYVHEENHSGNRYVDRLRVRRVE